MATKKKKKGIRTPLEPQESKSDLAALAEHMKQKPWLYVVAGAFVVACGLAGLIYKAHAVTTRRDFATAYARALQATDPQGQLDQLEALLDRKGPLSAEVLYLIGEKAFHTGNYDEAKESFQRVRNEFPESPYAPDAVEGLGFVRETEEDYEGACRVYEEILAKWPESFTALRQPINIARCQEKRQNYPAAIASYRQQIDLFPGSAVAEDAQTALDRLRAARPELFAETPPERRKPEQHASEEGGG